MHIIIFVGVMIFSITGIIVNEIREKNTLGLAHETFNEINSLRLENGLSELIWDAELAKLSVEHSKYMNRIKSLEHSNNGYVENILGYPGTSSTEVETTFTGDLFESGGSEIVNVWKFSALHNANMLDNNVQKGGIGLAGNYATFMAR